VEVGEDVLALDLVGSELDLAECVVLVLLFVDLLVDLMPSSHTGFSSS